MTLPILLAFLNFQSPVQAAEPELAFAVYKVKAGEYRWRLKSDSGAVLATSGRAYTGPADAQRSAEFVKKSFGEGTMRFETFVDESRDFRWRLTIGDGQLVAVSGDGYAERDDLEKSISRVKAGLAKAELVATRR